MIFLDTYSISNLSNYDQDVVTGETIKNTIQYLEETDVQVTVYSKNNEEHVYDRFSNNVNIYKHDSKEYIPAVRKYTPISVLNANGEITGIIFEPKESN